MGDSNSKFEKKVQRLPSLPGPCGAVSPEKGPKAPFADQFHA